MLFVSDFLATSTLPQKQIVYDGVKFTTFSFQKVLWIMTGEITYLMMQNVISVNIKRKRDNLSMSPELCFACPQAGGQTGVNVSYR